MAQKPDSLNTNMNNLELGLSTIPTRDLIWCILGDDKHGLGCAQITKATAIVLEEKLKDSQLWKVEYTNVDGSAMAYPMLWRYEDWKVLCSLNKKQNELTKQVEH